nr:hypothetical protein [Tanacetum cinerariifolium]
MASQETQQETQGSSSTDTDQPPLWEYVTKLKKQGVAGGAWKFKCNLCSETRQGSYSRVRAHLLGIKGSGIAICKSAAAGDKQKMKQLEEAYEEKKAESNAKEVALPCEAGVGFKKRKGSSTPIERAFGVEIRDQLDQEIARMFYTRGLPFNLLRTTLLQKENDNVHRQLEPLRSTWKEKCVTIMSDGWSDLTRKPLINFMATSEVINEIGHQNVVQIINDNAANCKAAGQLIEMARWAKNNTSLHCLAHSLNPRYYSDAWLLEDSTISAPHRDAKISQERMKCFQRLFPNDDEHSIVLDDYAMFSIKSGFFSDLTSISMMGTMEPNSWWVKFGAQTPFL